ncbi:membrane protein insertase YidC [Lutibacter sp. TH_r2]|uniref:membrane protein insertase YidC n=1 Tax=Lutibacter sp. TH_r2 TaxID=3082083 RepID=UPI002954C979|nr:membrane protein insertase YidC [Lutibacter sp. TH_r2]MDV7187278.1 membrane protein insertase YidC [Lutibacter sp. TH_r2]
MEEKKFDFNTLIGFALLIGIFLWWSYTNQPTPEEIEAQEKQKTEQVEKETKTVESATSQKTTETTLQPNDSLAFVQAQKQLGAFAQSANVKDGETVLENNVLKLVISNKGGYIKEALIKEYVTYDSLPLYMVKDQNASFNINLGTTDNRTLNTKDLFFEAEPSNSGDNQILSMKLKVSDAQYLEYRYEMKPDEYMIDFTVRSQGLASTINSSQQIELDWNLKGYRHEKSIKYENQQTEMYYEKEDEDIDYLSMGGDDDANESDVNWVAFKQHFFSSILISEKGFNTAQLNSTSIFKDEKIDSVYTKEFSLKTPLTLEAGELNYNMNWYIGPNDYQILKKYDRNIKEVINLGWGIFGVINRVVFVPVFNFLQGFIGNYGLIIILLTIIVRIIMSPLVYKSYLSSAKMKILKPEMEEINERLKGKENAMKRQQEVMALQSKAGVSPLSGCIPALLQMPVFFALFRFFPSNIDIRQQGFLWANDLSAYDSVFEWTTHIPLVSSLYGNHFSLFPVLASIAIFFYMRMSQSQQMNMQQPTQEGMPDMQKMMKMMMYFSPVMMLVFFNNYASGLSLYYFVSNLLTITIMLVIKNYILDEDKIHAKMQKQKAKPKKESKFRKRLNDAMKQAQEQQAQQKKQKKK